MTRLAHIGEGCGARGRQCASTSTPAAFQRVPGAGSARRGTEEQLLVVASKQRPPINSCTVISSVAHPILSTRAETETPRPTLYSQQRSVILIFYSCVVRRLGFSLPLP